MFIQRRLLSFITFTNWLIFGAVTACGFILTSRPFACGILAGGLIVTINFHLLHRSLKHALTPPHIARTREVLIKYYVRFLVTAALIYVLIADHYVNPLGLILGLSVVVTSIFIATLNEIRKIIFRRAA